MRAARAGSNAADERLACSTGERGLKATETIAAGEDVAMIPRSVALIVTDVSKCPCPETVDATFFRKSGRPLKLAITLLHERSLGHTSKVRSLDPHRLRTLLSHTRRNCPAAMSATRHAAADALPPHPLRSCSRNPHPTLAVVEGATIHRGSA